MLPPTLYTRARLEYARRTVSKRWGHFCWCCGRTRSNESFSGGGHARHLCKDCGKLGQEELTYRQAVRDIERMVQRETGRVKHKQRSHFAKWLQHPDERIRRYAENVAAGGAVADETPDAETLIALQRHPRGEA